MPNSLNFGFLDRYDSLLVDFAGAAESNVVTDPNTSLVKTRQFAEHLIRHVSAHAGLFMESDDFGKAIQALRQRKIIPAYIADLFDLLRFRGNDAAHHGLRDPVVSFQTLKTAYYLAIWFHRVVSGEAK